MKDTQTVKMAVKKQAVVGGKSVMVDGIRELDIRKLNRTPLSDYYRMAGKFVNVENYIYEATALYAAGTPITTEHVAELFTAGHNQPGLVVNTGAVIAPKQGKNLTNMVTDGEFDNGTSFLLEMICADVFLTSEPPTSVVNGAIVNPATNPIANYSAPNHYKAVSRQWELAFIRGEDQVIVDGKLYEFPSPFVASGAFGASAGGFIQNGFSIPSWNKLSEIQALQSNDRFRVEVRPLTNGFVSQVDLQIRVQFIGKRIKTVYPG